MTCETDKKEIKFTKEFMGTMMVFLIVITIRTFALEWYEFSTFIKGMVTMSPIVPLFWSLWVYIKHYRAMDEFMQRVTGESFLWTIGIISYLAFGYGLLEYEMDVPHISWAWLWPATVMGSGLTRFALLKHYDHAE